MAGITAFLNHVRLRITWVARDPENLAVLVLASAATLLLWPGRDWTVAGAIEPAVGWIGWLFWLQLWPALPAFAAAGRGTGGFETSVSSFWLPALPIGPRARSLADATVVLLFVAVFRGAAAAVTPGLAVRSSLADTALGAAVMLPTLISWSVPARSFNLFMLRPAVAAALVLSARAIGLLDTPLRTVTFCGLLSALVLVQAGRELRVPELRLRVRRPVDLYRPSLEPHAQVARDVWALSLRRIWPWAAGAIVALIAAIALEQRGHGPALAVFIAAEALIITLLLGAVMPFGTKMILAGTTGRFGYRFGDFARAWAVLPVRLLSVLRRTWVYSSAATLAAWLSGIAIVMVRSYLRTGSFTLQLGDGDSFAPVVLPFVAVAVTLPGFLIAAGVGHKLHAVLSGFSTILILNAHVMVLATASHAFPSGSSAPYLIDAAVVTALAFIGGFPPLAHLRNPRPTPAAANTASI